MFAEKPPRRRCISVSVGSGSAVASMSSGSKTYCSASLTSAAGVLLERGREQQHPCATRATSCRARRAGRAPSARDELAGRPHASGLPRSAAAATGSSPGAPTCSGRAARRDVAEAGEPSHHRVDASSSPMTPESTSRSTRRAGDPAGRAPSWNPVSAVTRSAPSLKSTTPPGGRSPPSGAHTRDRAAGTAEPDRLGQRGVDSPMSPQSFDRPGRSAYDCARPCRMTAR